ncbi:MAG: hypothetical protein COV47_01295 [Candidatus Diapherotrites archaeon CG11_big_fil_rev_8_21_14_0_20_37_9]|nr:MAG: hypothetical protein COV47_01295 [Candidatus Diapherotrites archaeon CG11_big_fil_rev_8_21_14_0_20_37_9]
MGWLSGFFGEMSYETKYRPSKNFQANNSDYNSDPDSYYKDAGNGGMSQLDGKIISLNKEESRVETVALWEAYRQPYKSIQKNFMIIMLILIGFIMLISGGFSFLLVIGIILIFFSGSLLKKMKKEMQTTGNYGEGKKTKANFNPEWFKEQ